MKGKNIWMGLVLDENEVVLSRACQSRENAKTTLVEYLQKNKEFDGKDFEETCSWIADNDLRMDLMVFEMQAGDFADIYHHSGLMIKPPPKEQHLYRVVYEIDVDAADEQKAAEIAWQIMRAEDALDPVVTVLNSDGGSIEFDLSQHLVSNKVTTGFVVQRYCKDDRGKFRCKDQEFVAGDDVQFENLKGDQIEEPDHEYQPFNMSLVSTEELIERLGDVLTGIDVGGEQSRQFAHEIKIISDLLEDLGWVTKD